MSGQPVIREYESIIREEAAKELDEVQNMGVFASTRVHLRENPTSTRRARHLFAA